MAKFRQQSAVADVMAAAQGAAEALSAVGNGRTDLHRYQALEDALWPVVEIRDALERFGHNSEPLTDELLRAFAANTDHQGAADKLAAMLRATVREFAAARAKPAVGAPMSGTELKAWRMSHRSAAGQPHGARHPGLSLAQMAELLCTSRSEVDNIERRKTKPLEAGLAAMLEAAVAAGRVVPLTGAERN